MRDGIELSCNLKESGAPIWLIATHGIGEHQERHEYLQDLFGQYFNIFRYDLRGHGKSQGPRADIQDFSDFMLDLGEIVQFLQKNYRMKRYVLFGHSMGGLITGSYIQNYHQAEIYPERIFLNAPAGGYPGVLGKFIDVAPVHLFKKVEQASFGPKLKGLVDLSYLSHDPRIKENYISDPLNCLSLGTRLLFGMVATTKETFCRPMRPQCPAMATVGSEDKIVNPEALKRYFKNVEHAFSFQVIEGAYHEIHNEIERFRKPYFDILRKFLMGCVNNETPET